MDNKVIIIIKSHFFPNVTVFCSFIELTPDSLIYNFRCKLWKLVNKTIFQRLQTERIKRRRLGSPGRSGDGNVGLGSAFNSLAYKKSLKAHTILSLPE